MRKALILAAALVLAAPAAAHDLTVGRGTLSVESDGTYRLELSFDLQAFVLGLEPGHPDSQRAQLLGLALTELEARLEQAGERLRAGTRLELDGVAIPIEDVELPSVLELLDIPRDGQPAARLVVALTGRLRAGAERIAVGFPREVGKVALVVHGAAEAGSSTLLAAGEFGPPLALRAGAAAPSGRVEVARRYLVLGFEHILPKGLDHILFVLALFFLSPRLKPLLWQVTAFTLAHTITLGLSVYGVVSLPASVVEPLIALSIAFVAVENLFTTKLHAWRPLVVFGFGLLHGLGFASVLLDLGLPRTDFLTALLAFNVGVETGQLTVIGLAWLLVGWLRARRWYRSAVALPASVLIALAGLYWTVQRIFF